MEINKDLRRKLLPEALVFKEYVKEDSQCNYEFYLREVINSSQYFRNLSDGKRYEAPPSEDHGECDAITDKYKIDFKLAESSSYLEAKRQYSFGFQVLCKGVVASSPPVRNGSTYITSLHCALRNINSYEQIEDILGGEYIHIKMDKRMKEDMDDQICADLKTFYTWMKKNKNLLLFIPEVFYFEGEYYKCTDAVEIVRQDITMDFAFACQYRSHLELGKDTFICCIYDDFFLIFKFEGNELLLVDKVSVKESNIFVALYRKYG